MATAAPQRTANRLDREAALAYYVGLGSAKRTYAAVAAKFGVSDACIRKWARREDWPAIAAESDRKTQAAALRAEQRTREQRARRTVYLRDLAADSLEQQFSVDDAGNVTTDLDPAVLVQVWKEADKQYRLDIGEVTERIEMPMLRQYVGEVADTTHALVARLAATFCNGQARAFVAAFVAEYPGVLSEAAQLVEATSS